jgi:hypothetical protein
MLKRILVALSLAPLLAFGQSLPSPTFNNTTTNTLTVNNTFTATGKISLPSLAVQAANTVVANATSTSASPTAIAIPSCSAAGDALGYTSGTGLTCFTGYVPLSSITGRLLNIQVFTSSGTYTPTTGANSAVIFAVGGGGGGGGAGATGSTQAATAGPGSSGSWGVARVTTLSTQTVTIGVAGLAGASGANAGGTGGQTSIGTWLVCPGGLGGAAGVPTVFANVTITAVPGGLGSIATSSATLLYGTQGVSGGIPFWSYNGSGFIPASGGSSPFGSGGFSTSGNSAGTTGSGHGSGGSGAIQGASNVANAGGSGTAGIIIVYEYS